MLYRVSGKLADGSPFSAKIEGDSPVASFVTARKALNDGGVDDKTISEFRVRPLAGKSAITFGKVKTPAEIAEAKAKRAAREASKTPAAATGTAKGGNKK
jgi:hypothetical protein